MEALSKNACRIANRVSLGMRYGETSGHREGARQIVLESFAATSDLLDQVDPAILRNWFEQFESVYRPAYLTFIDDPVAWSKFLGSQCDMLHRVGFHQKTIADVGDELAKWNRNAISFDSFGNALDGLVDLIGEHSNVLGDAIESQMGHDARRKRRTELFSNAVCGLAIVLVSINNAIQSGEPRDLNCAAMASFGASLTIDSVMPLFVVCDLA